MSAGRAASALRRGGAGLALLLVVGAGYVPWLAQARVPVGERSDLTFALGGIRGFGAALAEGVAYPRWIDDANRGRGAPVFLFYSPLAYYAAGGLSLLTGGAASAYRLAVPLLGLLSGLAFFAVARARAGPWAAVAGAGLYASLPYHLIDAYWRAAFAEFAGFVWLPLVFHFADRLVDGFTWRRWYGLLLAYAGLVLTHVLTAFLLLFVLAPYLGYHWLRARSARGLLPLATAGAAALLLCAVFLGPLLVEHGQVHLEWAAERPPFDWRRNFVFRDETELGFPEAPIKPWVDEAAFAQAIPALAAVLLLALRREPGAGAPSRPSPAGGAGHEDPWGWAVVAAWTLLLQTALSAPLWSWTPLLGRAQFPWRFSAFQGLAACFLVVLALRALREETSPRWRLALLAGSALPAILLAVSIARAVPFFTTALFRSVPELRTPVVMEYVPRGFQGWTQVLEERARVERAVLLGDGDLRVRLWETHRRRIHVWSPSGTTLRIRTYLYPGWEARADGRPVPIRRGPDGGMEMVLPPGSHEVELRFAPTPARRAFAALSTVTALALALLAAGLALRGRRGAGALLVGLLAGPAALLGCGRADGPPRDVVVVSLDTVRRDHLPVYGYERPTAPRLQGLARQSVVFERAFAQDTNTNPSHASLFTGLYPHEHGARWNGQRLPVERRTLAQILREAGFATGAFVSAAPLRAVASGLDRGFDVYDEAFRGRRRDGAETVRRARRWWSEQGDERRFLFVHLYDAHGPYRPEPEYAERFSSAGDGRVLERIPTYQRTFDARGRLVRALSDYVDRYDAQIRYADALLGRLLEDVDAERTLLLVFADHGETLGERYHPLDHGGQVFDEQMRIPLVLRAPGLSAGRVEAPVETVDVLPTLLALLELPRPEAPAPSGASLLPLLGKGREGPGKGFVHASARAVSQRHADRGYLLDPRRRIQAVRSERWKLVRYPGRERDHWELYDLEADPGETRDVAERRPEVREALAAALARFEGERPSGEARAPEREALPDALREQLRALGYVEEAPEGEP